MFNRLAVAAVILGSMSTAAMAADLIVDVPTPDEVMTSGWDGAYIGVQGGIYTGPAIGSDIFVGANMTVSESFLIGAEVGIGTFYTFPGIGFDIYGDVRGGVIVGDNALIYGLVGAEFDVPGGATLFAGVGAEVKVTDDVSIRGQGLVYSDGTLGAQAGVLFHF
ncbi:MAG: hypothetical protein ABIP15_06355 [Devosia sp.]